MKLLHELTTGDWVVVFDRMKHEKHQLAQIVYVSPASIEALGCKFSRLNGYCLDEDYCTCIRPAMPDEIEGSKQ